MPVLSQTAIKPRNGKWVVAMLAGGPADRARELRDKLAKDRGILVRYHLDYDKQNDFQIDRIPDDVDFVIIIKSQLGHANEHNVRTAIKRSERERGTRIAWMRTTHKWASMTQGLWMRGLKTADPLPLAVSSTEYFGKVRLDAPAAEPEPPKYVRAATPAPEPGPALYHSALADYSRFDTLALLRELQARLDTLGTHSIMITALSIEFGTERATPREIEAIPANGINGTNGAAIHHA